MQTFKHEQFSFEVGRGEGREGGWEGSWLISGYLMVHVAYGDA